MRGLITLFESDVTNTTNDLDEGWIQNTAAGVKNAFTGMKSNFQDGKAFSKCENLYKELYYNINQLHNILLSNNELITNLQSAKAKVISSKFDDTKKQTLTKKVDSIAEVCKQVGILLDNFKKGVVKEPEAATPAETPQAETPPAATPPAATTGATPNVTTPAVTPTNQNPAKVANPKSYNPKTYANHLSDWIKNFHQLDESTQSELLNEAAIDDRFDSLFHTILSASVDMGKVVASRSQGKYNAAAVSTMIALAFEIAINKGQATFVQSVKQAKNGFNRYRGAVKVLETAKNGGTENGTNPAQVNGETPNTPNTPNTNNTNNTPNTPNTNNQETKQALKTKYVNNRAGILAKQYIEAHPDLFDNTPENIEAVKTQILSTQKK